jgi:hypothetical protein
MRSTAVAAVALAAAGTTGSAHASLLWDFSFTGSGYTATGTLTTDLESSGSYLITGVSGTFDGHAITGLLAVNADDGNDNLLFPAPTFLDVLGFAFSVASPGPSPVAIGAEGGSFSVYVGHSAPTGNFTAALAAPEPASVGLFGAGLAGLGLLRRRRRA